MRHLKSQFFCSFFSLIIFGRMWGMSKKGKRHQQRAHHEKKKKTMKMKMMMHVEWDGFGWSELKCYGLCYPHHHLLLINGCSLSERVLVWFTSKKGGQTELVGVKKRWGSSHASLQRLLLVIHLSIHTLTSPLLLLFWYSNFCREN